MSIRKTFITRLFSAAIVLGGAGLAALEGGCSFVTNETAIQCTSQEECQSLGPAFKNTTCSPETKTCVPVAAPVECTHNSECIDKSDDKNVICRQNKCVALTTKECPRVLTGDRPELLRNDDVIILGLITPVGSAELGDAFERAASFAQQQITPSSTGTGLQTAAGKTRPLAIVSCLEFNPDGFDGLLRGANHLVKDVGVPIVMGPADPTNASQVARNVTLPNQVLHIAASSITSSLADLPNPAPVPMVWRLQWSDTEAVHVVQRFLDTKLIPKVQQEFALGPDNPVRIAIIAEGDFKGTTVARQMVEQLHWNKKDDGTPARCNDNAALVPAACQQLTFGDLNDTVGNPSPDGLISKAIGQIFYNGGSRQPPHIVLHSYSTFGIPRVMFPIEAGWDTSDYASGQKRPYHIGLFPPFNAFQPLYQTFIPFQEKQQHKDASRPLSQRIFALYPHKTEDELDVENFVFEFKQKFPDFAASSTPGDILTRIYYDTVYMAMYAVAANGDKPLTGVNVAQQLPRLVQGEAIKVGSADLQKAFGVLQTGQAINVQGVSGNIDLSPQTGAPKYSMEISCPGILPTTAPANIGKGGPYDQFTYSSFFYDENAGSTVGNFPGNCPTLTKSTPPDVWP